MNTLYTFLLQNLKKLQDKYNEVEFRNPKTIAVPISISEQLLVSSFTLNEGVLEVRSNKLPFKTQAERLFIEYCDQTAKYKLRKCELAIPYINDKGKLTSFTPAFFWVTESGTPQLVDVVDSITLEQQLKYYWANQFFEFDDDFKKEKYNYKIIILSETCKSGELNRLSFHNIFMRLAYSVARRSVSKKLQVGSVITSADHDTILSFGYNGDEKGGTNTPEQDAQGHEITVHAEMNSIIKLNYNSPQEKIMYVTHSPCVRCAKAIINANIKTVFYGEVYKDTQGVDLLRQRGVRAIRFLVNDSSDVAEVRGSTKANS